MDIGSIWNTGVVGSLAQALLLLYSVLHSWGLAIVIFTIAVRLIMVPLTMKQLQSSKAMQELQPLLNDLQKKYKGDREKLAQEQMKLYQEHGVNPMAGCLPMLVQMPIWYGLYQALFHLQATEPSFSQSFLWLPSLGHPDPFYILPVLTATSQWVVQKMMTPRSTDPQQQSMNMMMQFMPIMFGFFALSVPSGLAVYWVASNLFSLVQQYFVTGWGSLLPIKVGSFVLGSEAPRVVLPSVVPSGNGSAKVSPALETEVSASQPEEVTARARRRRSRRR